MTFSLANLAVLLIALLHVYILVLEMFLWDKPRGMKAFGLKPEFAAQTKVLAAGLYGAATASRRILFIQAVPATIGLVLIYLGI